MSIANTSKIAPNGFTLIEILVTVALVAILAALAAPSISGFVSRSAMRTLSSDFTLGLQRTRLEAVNRNMCATMCMSTTASSSTPSCVTSGDDWARGWIVFLNPTCNTALNTPVPGNLVLVRETSGSRYSLENTNSGLRRITFSARGNPIGTMGGFNLVDTEATASDVNINRTICLDKLGRLRVIEEAGSC